MSRLGPVGRVGLWTSTRFRAVLGAWLLVAVAFGVFVPRVETALSGAGWEASGSQSVQARQLIQKDFQGLGSYGLMVVVLTNLLASGAAFGVAKLVFPDVRFGQA